MGGPLQQFACPRSAARLRETPAIVLGNADDGRTCAPLGSQMTFLERPSTAPSSSAPAAGE
jgi:hypothetical protein